jgi:inner membrane transporter RhtA
LVLGGVVSLEGAAVLARVLFPVAGVAGTVSLRLGFAAVALVALRRPRVRAVRQTFGLVVAVGVVLAVHHLAFYEAVDRLPLGVAVTVEFAGPLGVALAGSRRVSHVAWALLAAGGVVAVSGVAAAGRWNLAGMLFALVAGACWAGYIMLFPVLARRLDAGQALAMATAMGAAVMLPYGVAVDHSRMFGWAALGLGAGVAVLADVISYSLQAEALGRLSGRVFSVLSSTEPAVGALFGLALLAQRLTVMQWAGVTAVVVAAAGVAWERA